MDLTIPQLGLTMESAELTSWLAEDGAEVIADQPIAELATDKIEHEVVAPVSGVLHRRAEPGGELNVGEVFATIEEPQGEPT